MHYTIRRNGENINLTPGEIEDIVSQHLWESSRADVISMLFGEYMLYDLPDSDIDEITRMFIDYDMDNDNWVTNVCAAIDDWVVDHS